MNYQQYASFEADKPPTHLADNSGYNMRNVKTEVPIITPSNITIEDIYKTPFLLTQDHQRNYTNMAQYATRGIQSNSELSKLYFSDQNIRRLQQKIRLEVSNRTNGQFRLDVDQEMMDLYIVMRAVYAQYARFLPNQLVRQVKRLNAQVIDEIMPSIITELNQEYGYIREINKQPTPIALPLNVSNAGRKQLPSLTTTFGV